MCCRIWEVDRGREGGERAEVRTVESVISGSVMDEFVVCPR